ncbi:SDR family oxidoreductase [Nocardia blacklockiae]|uniref:SDR family oxidoreductase n=1 Tax=Nocardia blacklockiae TaxID=480036 RepID=UPI0018939C43|nr:SDR family oxidoreductase [Nocardia blacklockiae]MBF6171999.1 SDR family oxidoreductase [Nocardia blacklockiae]
MRVFVTGASGHVGSAVVPELLAAGHEVIGLARSQASADALTAAGAEVQRGDLDDLDGLAAAATAADGVIHLAFKHEFMLAGDFVTAAEDDLRVVRTFGDALADTGKPLVATSGTGLLAALGRTGTETDALPGGPRIDSENTVVALADRGVRSSVVRLPPTVHSDLDRHGFVPTLIAVAREKGVSAYVGEGANRWPAGHTRDAAHLYRLALESAPAGSRLHAVDDEGVPLRRIAEVIGRHLDVPAVSIPADAAAEHFGFLAPMVVLDNPTTSTRTRELLGWKPVQPNLIDDLDAGHYFR